MPKLKTHSGAKKRFNLTKTGKVKARQGFQEPHPHQEGHQAHSSSARRRLCGRHQHGRCPQDDPLQISNETFEIGGYYKWQESRAR